MSGVSLIGCIVRNNLSLFRNILGIIGVKGAAVIVSFVTIPAFMAFFDDQILLGVWYSMLSILNLVVSFDLGLGNGLRNKLAFTLERGDEREAKGYISSSYVIVGVLAIVLCVICLTVFPYMGWNAFFNVSDADIPSSSLAMCVEVVFCGLMVQFVLKLINSVLYAWQRSALINLMALVSNAFVLVFVLVYHPSDVQDALQSLSVFYVVAMNLPLMVATVIVFAGKLRQVAPDPRFFDKGMAKAVLTLGLSFFLLQAAALVIGNTNEMLITWFAQPSDVVDYQVYYRVFSLFVTLFNLVTIPVWSAVTQKLAQGNYGWLRKCHLALMGLAATCVILMMPVVPFLQPIVDLWLGPNTIGVSAPVAAAFAGATAMTIFNGANCCMANGLGWLRAQAVFLTLGAVIDVPLAWAFIHLFESWAGVEIANAIALLPVCIAQPIYLRKQMRKHEVEMREDV